MNLPRFTLSLATIASCFVGVAAAQSSFGGGYAGTELGWTRNRAEVTAPGNTELKKSASGYNLRAFAGYDFPTSESFLIGAEVGVALGGPTAKSSTDTTNLRVDPGLTFDVSGRAGFAVSPNFLTYGRIGYANAKIETEATNTAVTPSTLKSDGREGGLFYGAGAEWAVNESVGIRTEYRRTKLGDVKSNQILIGASLKF